MKNSISIFALVFILGCANFAFGQCVFKETFTIPQGQNRYVKDYQVSLGNGNYRVEYAHNFPRDKMAPGFNIGFFNNRTDPSGENLTTYISGGSHSNNVRDKDPNIAYWTWATREQPEGRFRAGEFAKSDNFSNKNYTTLRISYFQGVAAGAGATGSYEIRIIGGNCNNSSVSNTDSTSKNNQCVFKETFTIPQGQNGYIKEYPVSLGNGNYRVEFSQNLTRDRMNPGFNIGFFNNRTDPNGESWTKYIQGGSHGYGSRDADINIAYWTWATPKQPEGKFRAGEVVKSDDFTNKNYTTLRISYWQGVGALAGAVGKYEIRIIGAGCSSGSSSTSKNSSGNNNSPQNDVPFDTNNQTNIKLVLFNSKKISDTDCLAGFEEVTTSITKRPSTLRAALEELIRYPEIQRGYLNFVKNVSLEDVKIENGVALIYLSGSLGDNCNHNRVLFQIGRTARQFSTVKSMRIFLNNKEAAYR